MPLVCRGTDPVPRTIGPSIGASTEFLPPDAARAPLRSGVHPGAQPVFDTNDPQVSKLSANVLPSVETAASEEAVPLGYNLRRSTTGWLVGSGDDLGIFSLESFPSLAPGESLAITGGMGFHFLNGPIRTDLPPRLFDFRLGFHHRKWVSETFGYDLSATIGAYSDFEGSARQGIRYPGHAVGYYHWSPLVDLVLGIEYLDRDDISLLPVAGLIIRPAEDLRLELVFPRPRVELWINPIQSLYVAGELGGGTWAIERMDSSDDVATYRDLRLLLGISHRDKDNNRSALELGYIFGRDLSYRSGRGDYDPDDTLLLRFVHFY